jgi:hypothetical protein
MAKDGLVDELSIEGFTSTPSVVPLRPVPTTAHYERDLAEADIVALQTLPRGTYVRPLQRIRSSHHALARCLAMGLNPSKAALVTGYSPGRISDLARDPTFKQLVAEYSADARDVVADYALRMRELGLDAMEEVHERLHTDPGSFSVPVLLDIVTNMADRTGHGTGQSVTHNFTMPTIDRPPRESYEQFKERRMKELTLVPEPTRAPAERLEPPTRPPNRSDHR